MENSDDGDEVAPTTTSAPAPLPKCFCNWKNCRTYQKALREYKHVLFNGVIKLKFVQDNPKSMALKASVDRTLHVDASKKNDWKIASVANNSADEDEVPGAGGGSPTCRYYVARHHFTEALISEYLQDRRAWDWNEPLTMKQAKTFLWSLDRLDVYNGDADYESQEEDGEDRYVQAPNVPKEQVKELVRKAKDDHKKALQQPPSATTSPTTPLNTVAPTLPVKQQSLKVNSSPHKKTTASSSAHTQSTQATTVTDSVHQNPSPPERSISTIPTTAPSSTASSTAPMVMVPSPLDLSGAGLVEKEQENLRLRQELNECQNQLTMLHSIVKELQINMIKPGAAVASPLSGGPPVVAALAGNNAVAPSRQRHNQSNNSRKKERGPPQSSSEEEDSSSEEDDDDDEDEDGDWSNGRLPGGGRIGSDDDETISTFHVNGGGSGSGHSSRKQATSASSSATTRKSSIHSRRSIRGRGSSNTGSTNSLPGNSHRSGGARRDSIHSRRSMVRHGGGGDDGASVVSRQSLQSISPSIKSLPREIELMDDEDDDDVDDEDAKDDYSFFDDSYRKPDDDARSVGSRSAASRASRRSIVSGARSRGRKNSRRPTTSNNGSSNNPKNKIPPQTPSAGAARSRNGVVPREIDVSGDELEDETYANVSTDTLFVTDKQIVDPYGEKGVYTGALSKSTGMPNGKGRLEYEKEGRWYEGDWIHGRWTGYGRLSNGDGDFYEGGLKNDHKHGTGVMRFADGRVFEGEYIRGQMIQGKMTYQDGSVYGGSWVDGMRHGRGKCIFVDGSEYEGEFREGNFHGHGQMTWNDGGWYVGEWFEGEMHGKGKEIRPDGTLRHDGEWARGQPIRSANDSRRRRAAAQHHSHVPAN
jgi:hypothetical protein